MDKQISSSTMGTMNSSAIFPLAITLFAIATFLFGVRILLFPLRHFLSTTPYEYNLARTLPSLFLGTVAYGLYTIAFVYILHPPGNAPPRFLPALHLSALYAAKASFSAHYYFLPQRLFEPPLHLFLIASYVISLALTLTRPVGTTAAVTALDISSTVALLLPPAILWLKPLYVPLYVGALATCGLSLAAAISSVEILPHLETALGVALTGTLAFRLQPPPHPASRPPKPQRRMQEERAIDFSSLGVLPDRLPSILPSIDSRDPDCMHAPRPPPPAIPLGWESGTEKTDGTDGGLGETPGSEITGMTWGTGWDEEEAAGTCVWNSGGVGQGGIEGLGAIGGRGIWGGIGSVQTTETETETATCTDATEVPRRGLRGGYASTTDGTEGTEGGYPSSTVDVYPSTTDGYPSTINGVGYASTEGYPSTIHIGRGGEGDGGGGGGGGGGDGDGGGHREAETEDEEEREQRERRLSGVIRL
ncbi:hypothetical protein EDC01DRAFT_272246 [Geopyxis carbonaria]|nr:hypothetical protein EDC01DRAFT_272246 [Geopyxis carbonaria]